MLDHLGICYAVSEEGRRTCRDLPFLQDWVDYSVGMWGDVKSLLGMLMISAYFHSE